MNTAISNMPLWRQTGVISAIAVLMFFAFTCLFYLLIYGYDQRFWGALMMALIIPWGIIVPLGWYMFSQQQKLVSVANRLKEKQHSLRQVNKDLEYKANFDAMTRLPNREAFFNHVDAMRSQTENSVLMIIDADHFKQINDSFGHLVGDQALILLAKVFKHILRKDDLIGRIGGEEFGILLPNTSEVEGQIIGEMIRHEIENTTFEPHKGVRHVITVSIGLAGAGPHHERPALMGNADTALFAAKRRGRNRVILFEPGMRSKPRPFYDAAQESVSAELSSNSR